MLLEYGRCGRREAPARTQSKEASGNQRGSGSQERQGLRDHSGLRRSSLSVIADRGQTFWTPRANSNVKLVHDTSDMCWLLLRMGEGNSFRRLRHASKRISSREIEDCAAAEAKLWLWLRATHLPTEPEIAGPASGQVRIRSVNRLLRLST